MTNLKKINGKEVRRIVSNAVDKAIAIHGKVYIMLDDEYCDSPAIVCSKAGPHYSFNSRTFWGYVDAYSGTIIFAEHWDDDEDSYYDYNQFCKKLYEYIVENYQKEA